MSAFITQEPYLKKTLITFINNSVKRSLRLYCSRRAVDPMLSIVDFEEIEESQSQPDHRNEIIRYSKDIRIHYNCVLYNYKPNLPKYMVKQIKDEIVKAKKQELYSSSVPLIIEKLTDDKTKNVINSDPVVRESSSNMLHDEEQFPFAQYQNVHLTHMHHADEKQEFLSFAGEYSVKDDIEQRLKVYDQKKGSVESFPQVEVQDNDDLGFRYYEDTLLKELPKKNEEDEDEIINYGTPNPDIPKSSVPCGGCGVHLHCQDEGLPGYVPSEKFCHKSKRELKATLCQRCYFLEEHNTALNVRVSPDIYEEALKPIAQAIALVIVVVDLLDFPCSVWPGLLDLIGTKRPVVVVGNKVDLIPLDNSKYVGTIKQSLIQSLKRTNLGQANIKHVCVVSAKTGYGVENLITQVQAKWRSKGDIYILGCTNAGKSTLFNTLLGSDMCKLQARDLVRRATASPWPGTTLNLLKFPIMRLSGNRLYERMQRLRNEESEKKVRLQELHQCSVAEYKKIAPTLTSHIGQTHFMNPYEIDEEPIDPFSVNAHRKPRVPKPKIGIDEQHKAFKQGHWCYDTPGTVQPDQFLGLLTHDELMEVLPREPIEPKCFMLYNSQSVFIGGLVRLDLLYTPSTRIRIAILASNLPITIVNTSDASSVYRSYLGSILLEVPRGSQERISKWPSLKPTNVRIKGTGRMCSADVVLSSAGFISISGVEDHEIDLRAWTPGGRGVHVRPVSMLPYATDFIGKRGQKAQRYHLRKLKIPLL